MLVKPSSAKRRRFLITCLTTQAVHVEVVPSMDTRSCLIGIKNSWPAVASPQLSSLIMARSSQQVNELLSNVLSWNLCVLNDSMIKRNIKWKFNPQSAPHHGGSMKFQTHVQSYIWNRKITDDILATPFCLVEQSLYARPLTTASSAATD